MQGTRLTLYQRDDCHLCDLALEVMAAARAPDFQSVFIDGDDALEQRYGLRVPVLRDAARGVELDWPFDRDMLLRFIAATPAGTRDTR
ncbi:MAG: glutaredoxin family protein [Pseudomonadota bacterium]|nr:glutaredoxin family protein [Pseudomonadota bacterium]